LQELRDAGKTQQLGCAQNGVFQPRLFFGFVIQIIIDFQIRLWWSEILCALQVVKILADFPGGWR
jgi:hypothetical protein